MGMVMGMVVPFMVVPMGAADERLEPAPGPGLPQPTHQHDHQRCYSGRGDQAIDMRQRAGSSSRYLK